MVFPVVMYGCGSWTLKNAEHWELMLSSWGAGEDFWESLGQQGEQISQSSRKLTLNIHWKDWCWSWNSNTFGYLMWRVNSLEKILMLGKIEGKRRRGWQRMRWLDTISHSMDMTLSKLQEIVEERRAWYAAVHGVSKSWTRQRLNNNNSEYFFRAY